MSTRALFYMDLRFAFDIQIATDRFRSLLNNQTFERPLGGIAFLK
jgi:hypothetical protein